ncbi:MAG: AAA family ATPase, partial [Nanoarchaeota archaeon]
MTFIKSLKLKGFKSFQKETEIAFSQGFSCILGPNGSGKSNVTDGILFVLGKLGSKTLRAENSANLIYNGGSEGKPAQEAMVELVLDNSNSTFPHPEKEVRVSRIVRRNGSSIYKINDEVKTRQEVLDLLIKVGISSEGLNIVPQGTISKFVEMKPEERRQLIEDLSGISVYEEKKEKSLKELEKTDLKIKDISIVLGERGTYLKNLEGEKEQALQYKNLKEGVELAKAALIFKQLEKRAKDKGSLEQDIGRIKEKYDKILNEVTSLKKEISQSFSEIDSANKEIELLSGKEQQRVQGIIVESREEIARLSVRCEGLREQLRVSEGREKQLKNDLSKTVEKLGRLREELKAPREEKVDISKINVEIAEKENAIISEIYNLIKRLGNAKREKSRDKIIQELEQIEKICSSIYAAIKEIKNKREALTKLPELSKELDKF